VNVLLRHELEHADGRRVFVYGVLPEDARLRPAAELRVGEIHRRLDPLTGEWVIIAPQRNVRPNDPEPTDTSDRACPLCPGGLELPFAYDAAVFENRFPSLLAEPPAPPSATDGATAPARGRCEVVVYTSRHAATFAALTPLELGRLLAIWTDRSRALWEDERHELVYPFENRGADAGATLAHPHGQIYAFDHVPPITRAKVAAHRRHRERDGGCLGCAVVASAAPARRVLENASFAVAVPFAPRWPYEVAVRARRHGLGRLADLSPGEQMDLLRALRELALRYDALFGEETPYLMTAQEAPRWQPDWHLAFEFYPLRRSATATKIRASIETGTGAFLNDVLPEVAAARLAGAVVLEPPPVAAEHLYRVESVGLEMMS
jgi:UDPglucose--hexose-1-phosphate uridylyltransferase